MSAIFSTSKWLLWIHPKEFMANVRVIESLEIPELAAYRTLRRPEEHLRSGIFVAEGEKVVRRLLSTGMQVHLLLMTPEWHKRLAGSPALLERDTTAVYIAGKDLLESIVGFNLHQGIMAVANLPPERSLDTIAGECPSPKLFVALDGLVNAENVGVVVRNSSAFGVHALVVGESSSSPYLRRAVRNSMGCVFNLPIHHSKNLKRTLRQLREEHGFGIIGTAPHDSRSIGEADFTGAIVLILGNEGNGISPAILEECTSRVAIPMMNGTDSLNVANASAVFLYEIARQRGEIARQRDEIARQRGEIAR
jgi:tRNA G18 (ribose-2'-O)-methylase SpoU